jgi:hypothetical protein
MNIATNKVSFLIIFFFAFVNSVVAQPPPPSDQVPESLPIDGSLPFFAVGALIYGLYVVHSVRIKQKTPM